MLRQIINIGCDIIIKVNLNNNIPKNVKKAIISNGKEQDITVFRIAKSGQFDNTTFLNSYDEIRLGYIENKDLSDLSQEDLENLSLYGTSCDLTYKKAEKSLKLFMRHYPRPIITMGKTSHGLSQATYERTHKSKDREHLDWWIYEGCADNSILKFEVCNEEGSYYEI